MASTSTHPDPTTATTAAAAAAGAGAPTSNKASPAPPPPPSSTEALQTLFRNSLILNRRGDELTVAQALGGAKYVGVLFSAHWCPPCRAFCPVLNKYVTAHAQRLGLKIVFASRDNQRAAFDDYFATMEWDLAFPYNSALVANLMRKYGINGIPCLVLLNAKTGEVVSPDIRADIMRDPEGKAFPYSDDEDEEEEEEAAAGGEGGGDAAIKEEKKKKALSRRNQRQGGMGMTSAVQAIAFFMAAFKVIGWVVPLQYRTPVMAAAAALSIYLALKG
jgi:nucleoredoxin